MISYYNEDEEFDNIGISEVYEMQSIIEMLYDCFPGVDNYSTPERRKVSEEYFALSKRVEEAFGPDFLDRLMERKERQLGWQGEDRFAAGFCVGVRLMAEVFTSATA